MGKEEKDFFSENNQEVTREKKPKRHYIFFHMAEFWPIL
jgi:hypothetical protein